MSDKDDRLQIRCSSETANTFEAFCAGYEDQERALRALLDAHADDQKRVATVTFNLE